MGTHGVKVVIIYPRPQDEQAFEQTYLHEHVPLAESKLKGLTRLVLTKVTGSPQGKIAAYRIAEAYFPSMNDLQSTMESEAGKEVVAHAQSISSGGPPLILFCEEEAFVYW
ncbi:MAG TPA: EthD family reductase [Bryobacteraceae bacterium]|nr:EthD family reductase [Bryobacteraceae bacterium]